MKAQVTIELDKCYECNKAMFYFTRLAYEKSNAFGMLYKLFPKYYKEKLHTQAEEKGWAFSSGFQGNKGHICEPCALKGLALFSCSGCGEDRNLDQVQDSFGDTSNGCAAYLCKTCFSTKTAKQWVELIERLRDEYPYDLE